VFRNIKSIARGVTVVELLLVIGVLVVILSLTAPNLTSSTAKAEMNAAVENVEFSIRMAKLTARQLETDVIMHLETDPRAKQHAIRFSFPAESLASENADVSSDGLLQDYLFPEGVRLKSDISSVRFDYAGEVEFAARIQLVAVNDDGLSKYLLIE